MQGNLLANRSAIDRSKSDFYPTPKDVTTALIKYLDIPKESVIWEPACGEGHMSKVLESSGYKVTSSDINNLNYGEIGVDFLTCEKKPCDIIITNPPFKLSEDFILRCIDHKVSFALLLKSQYWHSKRRFELFKKYQPQMVLPLTWRPDFLFGAKGGAPTMECIWTVWNDKPSEITTYMPLSKV